MTQRLRKKRSDATALTEADIGDIKDDWGKGNYNIVQLSKKYHIGTIRITNIIDDIKSETGGFVVRESPSRVSSRDSDDSVVEEQAHPQQESLKPERIPKGNPEKKPEKSHSLGIDNDTLDNILNEANKNLEHLEKRRMRRIRGCGLLVRH